MNRKLYPKRLGLISYSALNQRGRLQVELERRGRHTQHCHYHPALTSPGGPNVPRSGGAESTSLVQIFSICLPRGSTFNEPVQARMGNEPVMEDKNYITESELTLFGGASSNNSGRGWHSGSAGRAMVHNSCIPCRNTCPSPGSTTTPGKAVGHSDSCPHVGGLHTVTHPLRPDSAQAVGIRQGVKQQMDGHSLLSCCSTLHIHVYRHVC